MANRKFRVFLIKPSHYDRDGYVIQWRRSSIPTNSLASVYAVAMLRGRRDRYHRLGFLLPFTFAAVLTPVQIGVGDWAAHFVADNQPVKLAAMEGVFHTERGAPLHLGGIEVEVAYE